MTDTHNLFIPHRHEDDSLVVELKALLSGRGLVIRDASITSDKPNRASNPDYIKRQILAPGIRWAGKIVVLITPETKDHEWVDWEIDFANKLNKPIIGVWPHGWANCEVPKSLDKYANAIVGWNSDRIIRALNGELIFEQPDGRPRSPQPIIRHPC